MSGRFGPLSAGVVVGALFVWAGGGAAAQTVEPGLENTYAYDAPAAPTRAWQLAYGGRLYDRWWAVQHRAAPERTHPAYPRGGLLAGATTWRCVACHGWDYRGRDGASAAGPLASQAPALTGAVGADPETIVTTLRDRVHRYSAAMLPDSDARLLALFVSQGQGGGPGGDAARHIDAATGRITGDREHGRAVFQNACAACHQFDGRAPIFGEETDAMRTLGAIAAADPWRAVHKVRNGQPGADMLALRPFGDAVLLNVLSYVQTLAER